MRLLLVPYFNMCLSRSTMWSVRSLTSGDQLHRDYYLSLFSLIDGVRN